MPPKATKEKAVTVKGDEAEDMVLQYMKSVNRPYASTDVSANLKNKVTKTNAQKVLQLLAGELSNPDCDISKKKLMNDIAVTDKGSLTVKIYGKQTIFVYNQDLLPTMPEGSLAELDDELKDVKSAVGVARKTLKGLTQDLNKKQAELKTEELEDEIQKIEAQNAITMKHLLPLKKASGVGSSGEAPDGASGPIKQEELNALDSEWLKWRKEWVARKKIYQAVLDMVQPELSPANRPAFGEEIGVDPETAEASAIEASDLCKPQKSRVMLSGRAAGTIGPASSAHTAAKVSAGGVKRKRD